MLLIERPTRAGLIALLKRLIDGKVGRQEVLSWHHGVMTSFGYEPGTPDDVPLGVGDGYWYFLSLAEVMTGGLSAYSDDAYVIRDKDIMEYLMDLERTPARDALGPLRRLRTHQFDVTALRWPLTTIVMPPNHMSDLGLVSVRGIFDTHLDLVEHCHLAFGDDLYLIVRQFDAMEDRVMILGTNRDQERLREFLVLLELAV